MKTWRRRPRRLLTEAERSALEVLRASGASLLDEEFTAVDLRSAYRRLALRWHPDRHATAAEIYLREVETTSFELKDRQRECYNTSRSTGISLRILKNGSFGFAYSTQFTPDAYEQLVAIAVSSARYAGADEYNAFAPSCIALPPPECA